MTKAQLLKFIRTRNASGFFSNLQFSIDASDCGFRAADLGNARHAGRNAYVWDTPHGRLLEICGVLYLEGEPGAAEQFARLEEQAAAERQAGG